jgi:hypothetical protein
LSAAPLPARAQQSRPPRGGRECGAADSTTFTWRWSPGSSSSSAFATGVISGRDTLVWSAVYIAFTLGSAIGGRRGFNDGADTTMRAMKKVLDSAAVAVGVTVGESLQSLRDDDDRRQQAQNN